LPFEETSQEKAISPLIPLPQADNFLLTSYYSLCFGKHET